MDKRIYKRIDDPGWNDLTEVQKSFYQGYDCGWEAKSITKVVEALKAASDHLEYCGYGDNWERECAVDSGLPEQIAEALEEEKHER